MTELRRRWRARRWIRHLERTSTQWTVDEIELMLTVLRHRLELMAFTATGNETAARHQPTHDPLEDRLGGSLRMAATK